MFRGELHSVSRPRSLHGAILREMTTTGGPGDSDSPTADSPTADSPIYDSPIYDSPPRVCVNGVANDSCGPVQRGLKPRYLQAGRNSTRAQQRGALQQIIAGVLAVVVLGAIAAGCGSSSSTAQAGAGIHKIRHIVIIFQENRSFDSYFGTYPGATGIPMNHGVPTVCVPNPDSGQCVKPYPDHQDANGGGPHNAINSVADVAGGAMNGFIGQAESGHRGCTNPTNPACTK